MFELPDFVSMWELAGKRSPNIPRLECICWAVVTWLLMKTGSSQRKTKGNLFRGKEVYIQLTDKYCPAWVAKCLFQSWNCPLQHLLAPFLYAVQLTFVLHQCRLWSLVLKGPWWHQRPAKLSGQWGRQPHFFDVSQKLWAQGYILQTHFFIKPQLHERKFQTGKIPSKL